MDWQDNKKKGNKKTIKGNHAPVKKEIRRGKQEINRQIIHLHMRLMMIFVYDESNKM